MIFCRFIQNFVVKRYYCSTHFRLGDREFIRDDWTNVTPKILSMVTDRKLHLQQHHPLSLIRQRIVNFVYSHFRNVRGNPQFSVFDNLNPVVTLRQNFDSLLVSMDHPSRRRSESYYLNKDFMLRAHTSAHQSELISMGLDNFVVIGDVYRRDQIDSTHYPSFHQVEMVRLVDKVEGLKTIFETKGIETSEKQACHHIDASKVMELSMKAVLISLVRSLFGSDVEYRWVPAYFPFTHPSWELEIYYENEWMEVLGCGIVKHEILKNAGVENKIGWACGMGLERLAMKLYAIPDIRLFWSQDSGFLNQFVTDDIDKNIVYKQVSKFPPCSNDISFWLPEDDSSYSVNDFYELVRELGGDIIEQVVLIDEFCHPKTKRISHCYKIVYRHMEKTLTRDEVNKVHNQIEETAKNTLSISIR